jgi:predicted nuclease with TOPRIM domain
LIFSERDERTLREQLQTRLDELKREFETGQARLREMESTQLNLRETLLRISGAIQVLEETLAAQSDNNNNANEAVQLETR